MPAITPIKSFEPMVHALAEDNAPDVDFSDDARRYGSSPISSYTPNRYSA